MDPALQRMIDHHAITEVVARYARGIDRCDFDLVQSCYHPGATDDHGTFKGPVEEFIPWVRKSLERFDRTMHFLGNQLVLVDPDDPDAAGCETYCVAYHRNDRDAMDYTVGLRYADRFERRAGEWRIAARTCVLEWRRADPVTGTPFGPDYTLGTRDASDASYDVCNHDGRG